MSQKKSVDLSSDVVNLGDAGRRAFTASVAVSVVGFAAAVGLAVAGDGGWAALWQHWLATFVFFTGLALGGLFFVLVQHLTRAGWSVVVRRLAESIAGNLFFPMAFLAVPVLLNLQGLYLWADHDVAAKDHLIHAKAGWLNPTFFTIRAVITFGIWSWLAWTFHSRSTRQDVSGDPSLTTGLERLSAVGMLLFAITTTFFAFDWVMSLTPHWYSTIFGVYFFAGCAISIFAAIAVVAALIQRAGLLRNSINTEHYHDLGKLTFAFIVFWAYIAFSQHMLMWYANLPEETVWYLPRSTGAWAPVSVVLIVGHFAIPFFFLMSRRMKRNLPTLMAGTVWMLGMQWLDCYWLVMPTFAPKTFPLGLMDLALVAGMGGLFAAAAVRRMSRHALVPVKDPRLGEALQFENF